MSSLSVLTPSAGFTATTSGEAVTLVTGTRSRSGSKPARGEMSGFTRMLEGLAISSV